MNKKELIEYLKKDLVSDRQIEFISSFLNLPSMVSKNDLLNMANVEGKVKIDTAFPIDYYRRIEEVYPNIDKGNFVFDYRNNTFGELVNINDLIVSKMLNSNK